MKDQIPSLKGKEVYFLDFCPAEDELKGILEESKSVIVLDHHVSREELVKNLQGSVYDVSHSGAVLAWKYFNPDKDIPQLCLYVEDVDLWKWTMPNSREISDYMDLFRDFNFKTWDLMAEDLESSDKRSKCIENGKMISVFKDKLLESIIKEQAQIVEFEGFEVYCVNAPRLFRSDIGNKLAMSKPPFGIIWNYTPDEISISLRSVPDFDLIPLASKYGGGGHKNAANFRLAFNDPLPWKVKNKNHE